MAKQQTKSFLMESISWWTWMDTLKELGMNFLHSDQLPSRYVVEVIDKVWTDNRKVISIGKVYSLNARLLLRTLLNFVGDVAWLSWNQWSHFHGLHSDRWGHLSPKLGWPVFRKPCLHAQHILYWRPYANVSSSKRETFGGSRWKSVRQ